VSATARQLAPAPTRAYPTRAHATRAPAARPRTPSPPRSSRRARRGLHPAFWAFSAVVVTGLAVGLVSLSALVVETGFGIGRTEDRIAALLERRELLSKEVATRSAPGRVAAWARGHGLVMPEQVVVLPVTRPESSG
jgi:cell division protein FtsL